MIVVFSQSQWAIGKLTIDSLLTYTNKLNILKVTTNCMLKLPIKLIGYSIKNKIR